jgi:hypothetical protein
MKQGDYLLEKNEQIIYAVGGDGSLDGAGGGSATGGTAGVYIHN